MFTFKGRTSREMGLEVANNLIYPSSGREIEFINVNGRNGSLAMDKGRYDDVVFAIPVIMKTGNKLVESRLTNLTDWLLTDTEYHDFLWSSTPDYVYRAMCHQRYNMDRVMRNIGRATISFRLKPIKYLKQSLDDVTIISDTVITNRFNIDALPRITIVGDGDMIFQIGESELRLRDIRGGCIVDSEMETITNLDGDVALFSNMLSYPFPTLQNGNNRITFEGDIVTVSMQTKIGALI